jgi:superfamily I DNA/RNA helicase
MTRVQAGIAAKRSDQALQAIEDNADTITAIAEECTDVQGVLDALEDLFSDLDRPCVVLSTVHKAKGLEAATVFILGPELLPAPWAESANEKEQERNIHYVAVTRAMERLVYVKLPDKRK